jgi:hypothetical protein
MKALPTMIGEGSEEAEDSYWWLLDQKELYLMQQLLVRNYLKNCAQRWS